MSTSNLANATRDKSAGPADLSAEAFTKAEALEKAGNARLFAGGRSGMLSQDIVPVDL